MKNYILGALSILLSFNLHGMGGELVMDPISYTYYAKEIEQGIEAVTTAREHAKTALEAKDLASDTLDSLKGSLKRAQRAVQEVQRLKEDLEENPWIVAEDYIKDPESASRDLKRIYNKIDRIDNPTQENYDEWKKLLGEDDPDTAEDLPDRPDWMSTKEAKRKNKLRQIQNAVKKSAQSESLVKLQLEDLEKLSDMANTAMTQKDSTDVTNAILLEMLSNQERLIGLMSSVSRSMAFLAEESVNNGSTKRKINSLEDIKKELNSNKSKSNKGKQIQEYMGFEGLKL